MDEVGLMALTCMDLLEQSLVVVVHGHAVLVRILLVTLDLKSSPCHRIQSNVGLSIPGREVARMRVMLPKGPDLSQTPGIVGGFPRGVEGSGVSTVLLVGKVETVGGVRAGVELAARVGGGEGLVVISVGTHGGGGGWVELVVVLVERHGLQARGRGEHVAVVFHFSVFFLSLINWLD